MSKTIVIGDKIITSKEEANKALSELIAEFESITSDIEELADAFDLSVYLDVGGAYGTGAHRYDGEWQASSHSC